MDEYISQWMWEIKNVSNYKRNSKVGTHKCLHVLGLLILCQNDENILLD